MRAFGRTSDGVDACNRQAYRNFTYGSPSTEAILANTVDTKLAIGSFIMSSAKTSPTGRAKDTWWIMCASVLSYGGII